MSYKIPATSRASKIEYAIRDVVVPAAKLEEQGIDVLKLNIGDPLAYPGLPTPNHMIEACLLYTSPSPRDATLYRMTSSA